MRILLVCVVVAGCASRSKETPAAAATVMAGSMPSNAPAPEPRTAPQAGPSAAKATVPGPAPAAAPAAGGAMTAAEAAAAHSAQRGGGAGEGASPASGASPGAPSAAAKGSSTGAAAAESDDGTCASDADCTFTRAAPGACCPMLCTPRAVTRKAADALDAQMKSCARSHECPQPSCRPPRMMTTPTCVQSRCVVKVHDEKGMQ